MRDAVHQWTRRAARIAAAVIGGILVLVGVSLLVPDDAERCLRWRIRPIERTHVSVEQLRTLRATTPVYREPRLLSAGLLPSGLVGLALPDRIFVSSRLGTEPGHSDREEIVWHEIVHVEQMRQEGVARFAFVYVTDWLRGHWNGCGHFAAYEAIRYEHEAELYSGAMSVAEWTRAAPANTGNDAVGETKRPRSPITDLARNRNADVASIVDALLGAGFD